MADFANSDATLVALLVERHSQRCNELQCPAKLWDEDKRASQFMLHAMYSGVEVVLHGAEAEALRAVARLPEVFNMFLVSLKYEEEQRAEAGKSN